MPASGEHILHYIINNEHIALRSNIKDTLLNNKS